MQNILFSNLLSEYIKLKMHRNIIYCYLYGFETWSLMLREQHRQRVFENRVLRKIFWPKREQVTGEWRRLHNKELYNVYS